MLQISKTRRAAAVAAALGALALPAAASADDQSAWNLWHKTHGKLVKLRKDFERGEQRWENSNYQHPGAALKAARASSRLAHKRNGQIGRKTTSSALGARAVKAARKGLSARRRWGDDEYRAIKAFMHFDGYNYIRLHRKAKGEIGRFQKYDKEAKRLFLKAGVKQNP